MHNLLPWLSLGLSCIGNCGFWLFCFNRTNAFGGPRSVAKLGEKLCITLCFLIPALLWWFHEPEIWHWLKHGKFWPTEVASTFKWWTAWSQASLLALGPLWIESRRWLVPPKNLVTSECQKYNVHRDLEHGSAANWPTQFWAKIPMNEWATLEVSHKVLLLPRPVPDAEGLRIGHLSDLHFTGQYRDEHYRFAMKRVMECRPDLIVISGDIVDYDHCLDSVASVLAKLEAPLGVHFVLGNHDRRLKNIDPLLSRLAAVGFHDLGASNRRVTLNNLSIVLTGDERPWFRRREGLDFLPDDRSIHELRIGVAHTPDRIGWARMLNLDLLFAGHTHGGQVRLPGIGPLVAPSLHGSKFASGVFFLPPTLMHVSRGVAGTHTLRWRCSPEISLLTLTNPTGTMP